VYECVQPMTNNSRCDRVATEAPAVAAGKPARYSWKEGSLLMTPESCSFSGNASWEDFDHLETPLQFFRHFFTSELTELIVEQTVLYSVQCRPQNPIKVTSSEIEQFIGVALYMSLVRMANTRNYFSAQFRMPQVADVMTCKRFEEMKRYIHFADNTSSDTTDKLRKVKPVDVS